MFIAVWFKTTTFPHSISESSLFFRLIHFCYKLGSMFQQYFFSSYVSFDVVSKTQNKTLCLARHCLFFRFPLIKKCPNYLSQEGINWYYVTLCTYLNLHSLNLLEWHNSSRKSLNSFVTRLWRSEVSLFYKNVSGFNEIYFPLAWKVLLNAQFLDFSEAWRPETNYRFLANVVKILTSW